MRRLGIFLTSILALTACDNGSGNPDAGGTADASTGSDGGGTTHDGGGTTHDGGTTNDAGTDAGPTCPPGPVAPSTFDCSTSDPSITFGDPMTADAMTWTWVDFPGALCMDGSATGIGINLNPESTKLVIYLEGGGACFDAISCSTVANLHGYGSAQFQSDVNGGAIGIGLLDRTDANNPMKDANYVYIPYCSGDVHGGTLMDSSDGHTHVGYRNVTEYLKRIVPTFDSDHGMVDYVLLTGRSAGGLGTMVNYIQVQEAFDCTPVDALDDAGTLLPDDYLKPCLQQTVRDVWGLDPIIPSDCSQCTCSDGGGMVNLFPYLVRRYPDRRFGFVSSMEDSTFRQFFSFGYSPTCSYPVVMPGADYTAGLNELRALLSSDTNFHSYFVSGMQHTFTFDLTTTSASVVLEDWVTELVNGDSAWADVGP